MELIIGPMFSGKSTELIRRCRRLESIGKQVLIVNSSKDTRCGNMVQTHDKKQIIAIKVDSIKDIVNCKEFQSCQVIAIDEAQFFTDLKDTAPLLCFNHNKEVIICGLDGDFNQKKFGEILDLIPLATKVDKLSGYCGLCNNKTEGHFTIRRNSDFSQQELIGASDIYMCVCKDHIDQK